MSEQGGPPQPRKVSLSLRAPLTAASFPAGEPDFEWVLLYDFDASMDDASWAALGEYMGRHQQLSLNIVSEHLRNLDFLDRFGWLKNFDVKASELESVDGLVHLSQLENLSLERTKKRVSLQVLTELSALRGLSLADHSRELDILADLPALRRITLTGAKRDNLNFLGAAPQLGILHFSHGRITDLSALPSFPRLQKLTLYRTKVTSLAPISDCTALAYLELEGLPVADLPDLARLSNLKVLQVSLKDLTDLGGIAHAPDLRLLAIGDKNLTPDQFAVLADHPTLSYVDADSYMPNEALNLPRDFNGVYRRDYRRDLMKSILA